MNVQYHNMYSDRLGRDMELKTYGHAGKPVVVFPSSGGRFFEYEDFQMVDACSPFIEQGIIRLYTLDSVDRESWLDNGKDPGSRARRHNDYDAYVVDEMVPFIRHDSGYEGGLLATGCSMGGYHSANLFFRHPDVFDGLIALSGIYDARFFVGDTNDFDVYINSPVDYLASMEDPWFLDRYRRGSIVVCVGLGRWEEDSIRHTRRMQDILAEKNVPAWIDYWGYDVDHDWPWWRIMMPYFLQELHQQGKL